MGTRHPRARHLALVSVVGVAVAVFGGVGLLAQAQEEAVSPPAAPEATIAVGVYEPERVFEAYPQREAGIAELQQLAERAVEAQEAGDQEGFFEVQQQMEQTRHQIVAGFEQAVQAAATAVAEQDELDLVAMELVYQGPMVRTRDITDQLVERIGNMEEGPEAPQPGG